MNPRIKQLAEQAGFEITPWRDELLPCVHQEGPIHIELEKFAQLIIGKCAQELREYGKFLHEEYPNEYDNLTAENCAVIIEEQFGLWDPKI
jgi:hypothetical protein